MNETAETYTLTVKVRRSFYDKLVNFARQRGHRRWDRINISQATREILEAGVSLFPEFDQEETHE